MCHIRIDTTAQRSEKIACQPSDKKKFAHIYLLFILLFLRQGLLCTRQVLTCCGEEKGVELLILLLLPSRSRTTGTGHHAWPADSTLKGLIMPIHLMTENSHVTHMNLPHLEYVLQPILKYINLRYTA